MTKIYELTTNERAGFKKFLVRDIKDDNEAKRLAKSVFGRFYWKGGISYYADTGKQEYGEIPSMSKSQFLKYKEVFK